MLVYSRHQGPIILYHLLLLDLVKLSRLPYSTFLAVGKIVYREVRRSDLLALLIDKNPFALTGAYNIMPGAEAEVNMRVKMGQSSDVYAIVRADGKYFMAKKEIKVTLGGCGG